MCGVHTMDMQHLGPQGQGWAACCPSVPVPSRSQGGVFTLHKTSRSLESLRDAFESSLHCLDSGLPWHTSRTAGAQHDTATSRYSSRRTSSRWPFPSTDAHACHIFGLLVLSPSYPVPRDKGGASSLANQQGHCNPKGSTCLCRR